MTVATSNYLSSFINIDQQKSLFEHLYKDLNGYKFSIEDRRNLGYENDRSYTFGEVTFSGFKDIFEIISPVEPFEFLDLGSGLGKAMVIASLLYPCKKIVGYENLHSLAEQSNVVIESFVNIIKQDYPAVQPPEVSIQKDTLLNADFSTADVIFASSTCFENAYMDFISESVPKMKSGSHIIVLTKQLNSESVECVYKGIQKLGWGTPTVYIYKKL